MPRPPDTIVLQTHASGGCGLRFVDQRNATGCGFGDHDRFCFHRRGTRARFEYAGAHRREPRRAVHHVLRHHTAAINGFADNQIAVLRGERGAIHDKAGVEHRRQPRHPLARLQRMREQNHRRLTGLDRRACRRDRCARRIRPQMFAFEQMQCREPAVEFRRGACEFVADQRAMQRFAHRLRKCCARKRHFE
jgi:hypothetical protein